jgi:signal transduction histidine kinase
VIASNNDGVWNNTGASLEFFVAPAYYQTTWFLALCTLALAGLLWAIYQLRLHQIHRQFAVGLEERLSERMRIARELHDTLLQSFQGAVFQFQAARKLLLRNADNAMQVVDEAIHAAEEGIREGRNAIRDLRPQSVDQRSLAELLKATGHELASAQEQNGPIPSFGVIIEGKQQPLSLMLQDEVYKISREVIRNAFHHAAASRIEVEIRYDQDQLRLRIRDDGKGIDPKILEADGRSGHFGIRGIRERAQRIGSRLEFWSDAGAGTEVQLTVPATVAYEKRQNGRRFHLSHWGGEP